MTPRAELVHRTDGRARVRVRGVRQDADYFARVDEVLREHEAVREVETSSLTGSVLIRHDGDLDAVFEHAARRGVFELGPAPRPRSALLQIYDRVAALDARVREQSRGRWDVDSLGFYALLGAAVYQMSRGEVLPAGGALAIHAIKLMRHAHEREKLREQSG